MFKVFIETFNSIRFQFLLLKITTITFINISRNNVLSWVIVYIYIYTSWEISHGVACLSARRELDIYSRGNRLPFRLWMQWDRWCSRTNSKAISWSLLSVCRWKFRCFHRIWNISLCSKRRIIRRLQRSWKLLNYNNFNI